MDTDHNGLLSLSEAQTYILKEYGIGYRDVERVWKLVTPNINDQVLFLLSYVKRTYPHHGVLIQDY